MAAILDSPSLIQNGGSSRQWSSSFIRRIGGVLYRVLTLFVRTQEHALTDKESAIYKYLRDCDNIKHIQDLYNLPDIFTNENISSTTVINKEFFAQTVRDNTNIIDKRWFVLFGLSRENE